MAATGIVYDGIGSGGTLFNGKSFWVAQRVPFRHRWLDDIRANGGTVVQLEKMADILIADHARKDIPAGSYSWTFIEQSVKNGKLERLEDHLAGRAAGTSRPVGSSQPAKGRRTPFTAEDDRILTGWVTAAERKGASIKGNVLYQDLERANPRHTFQSWRDRWIKVLQYEKHPHPQMEDAVGDGGEETQHEQTSASDQPQEGRTLPGPVQPSKRTKTLSKSPTLSGKSDDQNRTSKISGPTVHGHTATPMNGKRFTDKEARSLLLLYDDIEDMEERSWDEAWASWAESYPEHTAEEWEEFWLTEIKPAEQMRRAAEAKSSLKETSRTTAEIMDIGDNAPEKYDVVDSQSFAISREEFANGQDEKFEMEPAICGRKVPLFRLWQVVHDEFGGFDSVESDGRWSLVATKLNFNTFRHPKASVEIRDAYFQNLADFEEFRRLWVLKQADEAGEELTDSQLLELQLKLPTSSRGGLQGILAEEEEEEDEDYDENDLDVPSSPPLLIWPTSQKHGREELEPELARSSSTSSKRQRIDKGKGKQVEIPSTPEDVFNANFDGKTRWEPSPRRGYVSSDDEDSGGQPAAHEQPVFAKPVQRNIFGSKYRKKATVSTTAEPETQDFHFSYPDLRPSFHKELGPKPPVVRDPEVAEPATDPHLEEDLSTQSQNDSEHPKDELQAFINALVRLGYEEKMVIEAMQATTMEASDVILVMDSMLRGDGIPDHIEGVWTAEDDDAVAEDDDGEYGWVVEKHGVERCIRRRQFLRDKEQALIALGQV